MRVHSWGWGTKTLSDGGCKCKFGLKLEHFLALWLVSKTGALTVTLFWTPSPAATPLRSLHHSSAKMKWCRCIAALYLACSAASAATSSHSDHDEHDHSDHDEHGEGGHFEAAALYTVEAGTSSIVAVPSEDMMDGTFAFMLVPAASADEEGLEGAEEDAEAGEWHLRAFCWHSTGQRRR